MKPLVIYHDNCTDGFGAAFAAWLKFGDEAEYLPMNYGSDDPLKDVIYEGREVYILDFSFQRVVMDDVCDVADKVIWLDHHKTAFEMWCGKYDKGMHYTTEDVSTVFGDKVLIRLDDNKSGALLAWEYFHPDKEAPMLIKFIDDRDRWQFKLGGSKAFHAAAASMKPWSFEQWRVWYRDFTPANGGSLTMLSAALDQGEAILRAQDAHVKSIAKYAMKCRVLTPMGAIVWEGLAVNSIIHQSEVGHELANASGSFGLSWYLGGDGRVKCSFRSNGDYDVSAIARAFGGGGHRNAAGCEVSVGTLMGWLK